MTGDDPVEDPVAASIDADGFVGNLADQAFDDRPPRDGIAGVSVWELGTEDPAALLRTIAGVERAGSRAVLLMLPVTPEYIAFHPRGAEDYASYEQAIAALAGEAGVPLIDLDDERDHESFADELHLNRAGATAFSIALAGELRAAGLLPG